MGNVILTLYLALSLFTYTVYRQAFVSLLRSSRIHILDVATAKKAWKVALIRPRPPLHQLQVDVLSHSGGTRLWDALQMAYTLIKTWKASWHSKAEKRQAAEHRSKSDAASGDSNEGNQSNVSSGSDDEVPILRVLVLSDGEDTKSEASAHL